MFEIRTIYQGRYEVGLKTGERDWSIYCQTKDRKEANAKVKWLNAVFPETVTQKGETQASCSKQ